MIWNNSEEYEGGFMNGKMHGEGIYKFTNNDLCKGTWDNNLFCNPKSSRF